MQINMQNFTYHSCSEQSRVQPIFQTNYSFKNFNNDSFISSLHTWIYVVVEFFTNATQVCYSAVAIASTSYFRDCKMVSYIINSNVSDRVVV